VQHADFHGALPAALHLTADSGHVEITAMGASMSL
jgi:hypothetical protein